MCEYGALSQSICQIWWHLSVQKRNIIQVNHNQTILCSQRSEAIVIGVGWDLPRLNQGSCTLVQQRLTEPELDFLPSLHYNL